MKIEHSTEQLQKRWMVLVHLRETRGKVSTLSIAWDSSKWGKVNAENLQEFVDALEESFEPGGENENLFRSGAIVMSAELTDRLTSETHYRVERGTLYE